MIEQEIINSNKLIAEFEGFNVYNDAGTIVIDYGMDEFGNENVRPINDLHYHSSWDWLMPVVDKIRTIDSWDVQIGLIGGDGNYCLIERYDKVPGKTTSIKRYTRNRTESFIECTYNAIIEFIKIHNNTNEKKI